MLNVWLKFSPAARSGLLIANISACSASPHKECFCSLQNHNQPRDSNRGPRRIPERKCHWQRTPNTKEPFCAGQRPVRTGKVATYFGYLISLPKFPCNLSNETFLLKSFFEQTDSSFTKETIWTHPSFLLTFEITWSYSFPFSKAPTSFSKPLFFTQASQKS